MTHLPHSLVLAALLSIGFALQAASSTEQVDAVKKIFKDIKALKTGAPLVETTAQLNEKQSFTQEELLALCESATKKVRGYDEVVESQSYEQLQAIMKTMVTQLKDYKVSGVGFATHPSWSMFYGKQNFNANLMYKNSQGETTVQTANIAYTSFGWQSELVWRFDVIFAVGTDLSRYSTRTPLEFSTGFTAGYRLPFLCPKLEERVKENLLARPNYARGLNPQEDMFIDNAPEVITTRWPLGVIGVTMLPFKSSPGALIIAHFGMGVTGILPTAPPSNATIMNEWTKHMPADLPKQQKEKHEGDASFAVLQSLGAFNLALVMSGGTFTAQEEQQQQSKHTLLVLAFKSE